MRSAFLYEQRFLSPTQSKSLLIDSWKRYLEGATSPIHVATISKKECVLSVWLTKSKLISAHQCRKRLWLEVHEPGLEGQTSGAQNSFQIGQEVGVFARSLYPGGTLIGHVSIPGQAVTQTQEFLSKDGPITLYEAAFAANGALTRRDILQRDAIGRLRLIEVKASTSVKDVHLIDCAIQGGCS